MCAGSIPFTRIHLIALYRDWRDIARFLAKYRDPLSVVAVLIESVFHEFINYFFCAENELAGF